MWRYCDGATKTSDTPKSFIPKNCYRKETIDKSTTYIIAWKYYFVLLFITTETIINKSTNQKIPVISNEYKVQLIESIGKF